MVIDRLHVHHKLSSGATPSTRRHNKQGSTGEEEITSFSFGHYPAAEASDVISKVEMFLLQFVPLRVVTREGIALGMEDLQNRMVRMKASYWSHMATPQRSPSCNGVVSTANILPRPLSQSPDDRRRDFQTLEEAVLTVRSRL